MSERDGGETKGKESMREKKEKCQDSVSDIIKKDTAIVRDQEMRTMQRQQGETRLRMAAFSFIISSSFRLPVSPVDSRDHSII